MLSKKLPEFILKASINNQITIGMQNVYRRAKDCYKPRPDNANKYQIAYAKYKEKFGDRQNGEESFAQKLERLFPRPLDIKKKSQRAKKSNILWKNLKEKSEFNQKHDRIPPFGAKQGQKLREAGAAIDLLQEKQGGASRIITLTLVGDRHEAFECLAANSGYIINRLFQIVRRKDSQCNNWFFVWEHQKRGALHLHICLWHQKPNMAAKLGAKLVQNWYKILEEITEKTGVDMFVRADKKTYTKKQNWQSRNEPMRKSAGGYFSKYASKASSREGRKKIEYLAQKYPPSRFWGSSQSLKNIIKANTFIYNFESHKSDESQIIYEEVKTLINQFNIAAYNLYEWDFKLKYSNNRGDRHFDRTITEGFKQNYYFARAEYLDLLDRLKAMLGAIPEKLSALS